MIGVAPADASNIRVQHSFHLMMRQFQAAGNDTLVLISRAGVLCYLQLAHSADPGRARSRQRRTASRRDDIERYLGPMVLLQHVCCDGFLIRMTRNFTCLEARMVDG
jgi:hypothetical protein